MKYIVSWIGDCQIEADSPQKAIDEAKREPSVIAMCSGFNVREVLPVETCVHSNASAKQHPCPYQQEFGEVMVCTCCEECTQECMDGI